MLISIRFLLFKQGTVHVDCILLWKVDRLKYYIRGNPMADRCLRSSVSTPVWRVYLRLMSANPHLFKPYWTVVLQIPATAYLSRTIFPRWHVRTILPRYSHWMLGNMSASYCSQLCPRHNIGSTGTLDVVMLKILRKPYNSTRSNTSQWVIYNNHQLSPAHSISGALAHNSYKKW